MFNVPRRCEIIFDDRWRYERNRNRPRELRESLARSLKMQKVSRAHMRGTQKYWNLLRTMHIADCKNAQIVKFTNKYCNSWYGNPWNATKTNRNVQKIFWARQHQYHWKSCMRIQKVGRAHMRGTQKYSNLLRNNHIADFKNAKILIFINNYCNSWYGHPWMAIIICKRLDLEWINSKNICFSLYMCKT